MSKIVRLSFVLFFMFAMSAIAFGQSTVTGAITGLVTNPNREVVPGASVTAKNLETNREDTATTDGEGRFRVVNLQPGTYTVTVNVSGFAPFTRENVVVEVGRLTPLDVPLAVQGVTGTVEVTSEAPVINTTQQDFTTNINQVSLDNLPSNGRRWSNYALSSPGTAPDGGFGLVSFRGISGLLNNNTIDGGDNNQAFFSEERGRTRISYVIGLASIREFQVNTSNFSAEYGRAAGGVVNAVTKSGTNQFHGSAFYYDRDNKWGARNPRGFQSVLVNGVSTQVAIKPADKRQQFGGTIGGPIVKDRLFFFFSYDQQKRNFPGIAVASSPSFFNTVDRAGLKARNLTDAQIDSTVSFLNSLTGTTPRRGDQRILLPKIDWRISDNHTFTATYNRMRWKSPAGVQTAATVAFGRQSFGDDFVNVDSLNLRLASTFQPNLVNEARFQWGRDKEFQNSQTPAAGEPLTGPNGKPPQISITNGFTFGKPNFLERKSYPDEKRWQYADTVTLSAGKHTFKWGGDLNYVKDILDNLFTEEGQYAYSTINDFIVDYANFTSVGALRTAGAVCPGSNRKAGQCYNGNYLQGFGPTAFKFHTTDVNFFVQDDYRATSRLTLNLGLRYEYERLPIPQVPNLLTNLAGQAIGPDQTRTFPADKNNIGPRLGLAYDLSGNGKSSIRAGYGVYYGRVINSTISNAITNTGSPQSQLQFQLNPASTSLAPVFPTTFASASGTAATSNIVVFSPGMKFPIIHEGDFVFEREVARNTVFSVSYLFSFGHNLPTFIDRNLPTPTSRTYTIVGGDLAGQKVTVPFFASPRPDSRFGAITEIIGNVNSKYNALVLQINRRLTKGLQFDSSYTLSKATDTGQLSQTFTATNVPYNPFDLAADTGPTNFDIPHKFVASVIWQPKPFSQDSKVAQAIFNGFTIAPIFTAASGVPYSANTGTGNPAGGVSSGITASGTGGNASFGFNRVPMFPRNYFRQPKIVNVDMRVSRRFHIKEKANIELLAEGFNIFNRTQVTALNTRLYIIGGTVAASTLTFDPTFQTLSTAGNSLVRERQVQLAARFEF